MKLVPQLAEAIKKRPGIEHYLGDNLWVAQQKLDGERLLLHITDGVSSGYGRRGQSVPVPGSVSTVCSRFAGEWVIDGEYLDGVFWVFDMPQAMAHITPDSPYETRFAALEAIFEALGSTGAVKMVPLYRSEQEKRDLLARVQTANGEGIVLKRLDGHYQPGRRCDNMIKVKFWKACEVVITDVRIDGKDNAMMALCDVDNGKLVPVGTVSTIGKGDVNPGDVFEVKFLYCVDPKKPRLYQPTILRKRLDKEPIECTIDQLDGCFTDKAALTEWSSVASALQQNPNEPKG